ncbi:hypothetical protein WJR50_17655 [Catalinimonas sp. 4WD22]|uniref:hypothetical protein n=1 Tax=Catalinimonas locisalis TaxID=3133978 RepID=UPI0031019807
MRTCGMMGEVVGYASYVARKHNTNPRGVHQQHLDEFIGILENPSMDLQSQPINQELKRENKEGQ